MNYKYICPVCGCTWASESFNSYPCPVCHDWYSICTYAENDITINAEEYQQILSNVENDFRYDVQCEDCGKTGRLYIDKWCRCSCGGSMVKVIDQQQYTDRLKQYRHKKKLTQQQMADKIGISRSYYSEIERNKKPLNVETLKFISKHNVS